MTGYLIQECLNGEAGTDSVLVLLYMCVGAALQLHVLVLLYMCVGAALQLHVLVLLYMSVGAALQLHVLCCLTTARAGAPLQLHVLCCFTHLGAVCVTYAQYARIRCGGDQYGLVDTDS